jgi:hypothetical protein
MTTEWLRVAKALKAKYPKNTYIKMISSGTWEMINQRNKLSYTADQINNNNNLDYGLTDDHKYLKLVNMKKMA